jgi:multidrug resistance efflux pump
MKKSTDRLYESRLLSAKADIESAGIRLKIAKNDAKLFEDNLENSQGMLSGSVLTATERQAQAKQALELVRNQLANTTELLKSEEASLYRSSLASLSNAFILARTAREYSDLFLGVTDENRNKNDAFENLFDANAKTKAEKSFHDFDAKYQETYDWYYANVANRSTVEPTVAKEALTRAIPTLEALRETLHSMKNILETAIPGAAFPQSTIDAYQQKTNEYLTGIELALNTPTGGGLQGSSNAIEAFDRNRRLKISELNDSVALAEKNLSLADIGKDVSGNSFQNDLNGLKTELAIKKDNVKLAEKNVSQSQNAQTVLESERKAKLGEIDSQIAELGSKLAEAKMQAGLAGNSLENQSLRAPFDGVILKKYSDVGTVVGTGIPVVSLSSQAGEKVIIAADGSKFDLKK